MNEVISNTMIATLDETNPRKLNPAGNAGNCIARKMAENVAKIDLL